MDRFDHEGSGQASGRGATGFGRIVVLDGHTLDPGDNSWDEVAAQGSLKVHERTDPAMIVERARGADVVLTNKTVLDAAVFEELGDLRLVSVLATGVNVVDLDAASRHGVTVCNVPGYGTASVAQHTFALVLEVTNAVGEHARAVRGGAWAEARDFSFWRRPLVELAGRRFGIVGYGRIGAEVGRIARAFGMRVRAFRPSGRRPDDDKDVEWSSIAEIFATSDVVSLHCPLTEDNRRFVDAGLLATMREGSTLVNTARGDLIDEEALVRALDAGRPMAAALDVLGQEPPARGHPLARHLRCLVTPHLAWATLEARRRVMAMTAANLRAFAEGRPRNVVNSATGQADRRA